MKTKIFLAALLWCLAFIPNNIQAQFDSTDCQYNSVLVLLETGIWASEINFNILDENGNLIFAPWFYGNNFPFEDNSSYTFDVCLADGCYSLEMFDTFGDGWNGGTISIAYNNTFISLGGLEQGNYGLLPFGINTDEECQAPAISGCTDPNALNYNPNASEDDGSCEYPFECDGVYANLYVCTFSNGNETCITIADEDGNVAFELEGQGDVAIEYYDLCLAEGVCYTVNMSNCAGNTGWYGGYFWINVNGNQIIQDELDANNTSEVANFSIGGGCPELGCTDPEALNYNPNATEDDGSCVYPEPCDFNSVTVSVVTQVWGEEVSWQLYDGNDNPIASGGNYSSYMEYLSSICLEDGCYYLVMNDSFGDGWNGATIEFVLNGVTIASGTLEMGTTGILAFGLNTDDCSDVFVLGCTDPEATNYNADATIDDGSCEYPIYGCTDPLALNYSPWANTDDGSCIYPIECDSTSTAAQLYVCTFANGNETCLDIIDDNGNVVFELEGQGDGQIAYYDICLEEGVCYTAQMANCEFLQGWNGGYFWITVDGYQIVQEELDDNLNYEEVLFSIGGGCPLAGCTDPEASNYNPDATEDDGSCIYPEPCEANEVVLTLFTEIWGEEISWAIQGSDSNFVAYGDGYASNSVYTEVICLEDGCYTFYMMDSWGDGWNGAEVTLDLDGNTIGSGTLNNGTDDLFYFGVNSDDCVPEVIYGCTDPNANNYNPEANADDGSCEYDYYGCTDPNAWNYNPVATIDDGSCEYFEDCLANQVYIVLITGEWGYEVSWNITDAENNVVAEGSGYDSNMAYTSLACLEDGCYTLNMFDSFGDGWNGGLISLTSEDEVLGIGELTEGQYGFFNFGINDPNCSDEVVFGCTDPAAINYNANATFDDGSCIYGTDCDSLLNSVTLFISTQNWGNEISWDLTDGNGNVVASGSDYESNSDYTISLCLEDACYEMNLYDSWGDGWNGGFYMFLGNGVLYGEGTLLYGSSDTQPISINGDCAIYGCTDPSAINYSPFATEDDGNCLYGDGFGIDPVDYMEVELDFDFFPNPVENEIQVVLHNINPLDPVLVEVHDGLGRLVISEKWNTEYNFHQQQMNLSDLGAGLYILSITNGQDKASERMIVR